MGSASLSRIVKRAMRIAFWIFTAAVGVFVAYIYPFVAVLRRRGLLRTILSAWFVLSAFVFIISLVLPWIVSLLSPQIARELMASWVPESIGVGASMVAGWVPPLMAGVAALLLRAALEEFWPRGLAAFDKWAGRHEPNA